MAGNQSQAPRACIPAPRVSNLPPQPRHLHPPSPRPPRLHVLHTSPCNLDTCLFDLQATQHGLQDPQTGGQHPGPPCSVLTATAFSKVYLRVVGPQPPEPRRPPLWSAHSPPRAGLTSHVLYHHLQPTPLAAPRRSAFRGSSYCRLVSLAAHRTRSRPGPGRIGWLLRQAAEPFWTAPAHPNRRRRRQSGLGHGEAARPHKRRGPVIPPSFPTPSPLPHARPVRPHPTPPRARPPAARGTHPHARPSTHSRTPTPVPEPRGRTTPRVPSQPAGSPRRSHRPRAPMD
ncbi:extensin-like [Cricetulus griseus]|uniref:Extensin-like n=1 Tax=Cricetulus griseus TaxID=10029 RepID=A0A9J7GS09_CRIGR|nr:extensin-like [Cricetulus griseus]